jgi:hypothetical protein
MQKNLFKMFIGLFIVTAFLELQALESRLAYDTHLSLEMSESSSIITLEDGSQWQVFDADEQHLALWYERHNLAPITITPNYLWDLGYNGYLLSYQDTASYITASLVGAPQKDNPNALTIAGMDKNAHGNPHKAYYRGCIYLNNGSFWLVSMFDWELIENWQVDDIVVVGKEGGWFPHSPHILINTSTNTFARVQRL